MPEYPKEIRETHLVNELKWIVERATQAIGTVTQDAYVSIEMSLLHIEKAVIECRAIMLAYPKE